MALGIAQMSSIRSTISGHQSRTVLPYHLHWTTNLNQNCCEQDDAGDDRGDDDDDNDDVGFPTVGFPNAELISKLLNKIYVRVDVSKWLKTYFLFENEILIDDIVVIFGIYGVDFPPKGSPKRS